jgi:hypothetical protein
LKGFGALPGGGVCFCEAVGAGACANAWLAAKASIALARNNFIV